MPLDIKILKQAAAHTTIKTQVTVTGGIYSFGIVYSKRNGKRLSFSKALADKLSLTDSVALMPIPEQKVLLIGKKLDFCEPLIGKLSGDVGEKRLCYNSGIAATLIDCFELDFTNCTSQSFGRVEFDKDEDGTVIAVIKMA